MRNLVVHACDVISTMSINARSLINSETNNRILIGICLISMFVCKHQLPWSFSFIDTTLIKILYLPAVSKHAFVTLALYIYTCISDAQNSKQFLLRFE